MTQEKIAGFLFGIGIGTMLGFFLRNDAEENNSRGTTGVRQQRGGGAPGNASGRSLQAHSPVVSRGVEADRTVLAV
jgi:hypothetical protein